MNNDTLAAYYISIKADVDTLRKEMDTVKKNVSKDVDQIKSSFKELGKSGAASFDGINPSVKELQKRLEDLRAVLRSSHKDSKAYAIASRESELVLAKLGETTDQTTKKSRGFKEGLKTLATQFFNTAGAGSGMGTVLSTLAYGIFSGGGILAAAGAATLAFQLLTKSQKESKAATIEQIEEIKKLSEELDNMSRKELMKQMVKNMFEISNLEAEAKSNVQKQLEKSSKSALGGSVVLNIDPVKTLTAEQQEQLKLLKEQNSVIDLLIKNRSVLKGIDAEISDLRKQQNTVTEDDLRKDPKKLENLQKQIDGLEKYAKVLRGISDSKNETTIKTKVYGPQDVKAKYLGYDEESLKREQKLIEEGLSLNKIKRGELVLLMKETNQVMLDDSMFTTDAIVLDWIEKDKILMAANNSLIEGITRAFHEIRIRASSDASALENIFVDMANSFILQVQRMAAEWAAFQLLKGVFSIVTGGASLALPVGHSGGNFIGTSSGVKKMAGGGSFIVPPGFPNDSYPLLVESGERVTVNPTSQTGMESRLLKKVVQSLQVLNSNMIEGQLTKARSEAVAIYGKIENDAIYLSNKRAAKIRARIT
ncbi:MAG: hypothetical protein IH619_05190 [Ignavibacterium sp.]|nr:hypothetical protein [Ignavibacterium sp.]